MIDDVYQFTPGSLMALRTCHPDIVRTIMRVQSYQLLEFQIVHGFINESTQKELFRNSESYADGVNSKEPYNYKPSRGIKIKVFTDGKECSKIELISFLGGLILSTSKALKISGLIDHEIKWLNYRCMIQGKLKNQLNYGNEEFFVQLV